MPAEATTPRRGQYRNGIQQRQRILESATEIFASLGFVGGSLRKIAAQVGVGHAAILQHFGSKEGLLLAVLRRWDEQLEADVEGRGLDYLKDLNQLIEAHMARRSYVELFATMAAEASSPEHPAREYMTERYARTVGRLRSELQTAIDDGQLRQMPEAEVEAISRRIVAMMDGIELQWLLDPSVDMPGVFAAFLDELITARHTSR